MIYLQSVWSRSMNAYARLAACAVLALVAAACRDNPSALRSETPAVPSVPVQIAVEVYGDRLDPEQLVLDADVPVQVEVFNRSQAACSFYVGDYLRACLETTT